MTRWALLLTLTCCACAGSEMRSFHADDEEAIARVLDEQREAWNRGDIDGFMKGYAQTPELVFTSGAQIRNGWQATLESYQERYGQDARSMGQLSFERLQLQSLGADGAVVLGRWALSGLAEPAGGIFSVVFERRPEGWRIVHDHTSSTPRV